MKNRKLILIVALAMVIALFADTSMVSASKLSSLQDDIKNKQEELEKGQSKEKSLSGQVNDLEAMIYQLEAEISNGEVELAKLEKELKEAQKKVDKQNENLGGRLRIMYKNGSVGFLDVLMNSNSFSEFLTNIDLVEKIYASDKDVLEELQLAHDEIEKKKEDVEELQANLKSSKATAEAEKKEIESQKAKIAADNKETARMLDDLESEANALEAKLQAQSGSGQISNSSTSKYTGGALWWPTPGFKRITSNYGWRICPFHGREFHGAIDIGANSGSDIIAAGSGTVISSGYNGGFGYSIQIDHGGGLVTMYNHCSALYVSRGAKVKAKQVIAAVGSTGSSTGPHLDFRVFKNGSTVNPLNYVK